jgi:Zinc finger, C3HC4 type (RING finger)
MFSSDECVICLEAPPTQVFHDCNHLCTCTKCCDQVQKAKLHCPLCRRDILSISTFVDVAILPTVKDLENWQVYKSEYVAKLKGCSSNAGFLGKSKLARSVAREFGDEMEQRVKESAGGDRCMGKKYQFTREDDNLNAEFKMGRRTIRESYPYAKDWQTEIVEYLAGDTIDILDVAVYYPEIYMAAKYEDKMDELNDLISGKKIKLH